MIVVLIHWRIRPEEEHINAFLDHWKTKNTVEDRKDLIGEFLNESLPTKDHPYTTWHLDSESLGDFKSYVTVGLWENAESFNEQIARYFNDENALLIFEKYRRRRVILEAAEWRVGMASLDSTDSPGVV